MDIEILVDAIIESAAITIPAEVAPNPHIILEGFQVKVTRPKEDPAVIIASFDIFNSDSDKGLNLNASNEIVIPATDTIPEYCPSTPLDQDSKFINHRIQINVKM